MITKNGEELNILSAKKLNQEEIDKLLGINYVLFKNIVAVASTYNKPFLVLSTGERRSLVETIFNIYVLALMLKEVKRRNTVNSTQQKMNMTALNGLNEQKFSAEKFVNDTEKIVQQFELDKTNKINELVAAISAKQSVIERCNKNISIADKKMSELQNEIDASSLMQELANLKSEIDSAIKRKTELQNTLTTLNQSGAYCQTCGTELTEEHREQHANRLLNQMREQDALIDQDDKVAELQADIAQVKKNKSLYDTIIMKRTEQVNLIEHTKDTITDLTTEKENVESSTCNIDVQEYKNQLQSIEERIKNLTAEMKIIDDRLNLDATLIDILGDDGLKTYFFKQLLPQLNSQVNTYITQFGMQITLEFDQNLDAHIQQGKYECDYMQFSAGERARIDMAILLAFFDISRNISNWSCNILFIDEVLDGGVDSNGTEQFITTLYNIVSCSTKNDLGIYLISHKLSNIDVAWDSIVEIKKTNRFSELKVIDTNESSTDK